MPKRGLGIGMIVVCLIFLPATYAKTITQNFCKLSDFKCIRVKRHQSWESLFPDDHDRDIVKRINRLNIELYPGILLAVPKNLSTSNIMDFSPFPLKVDPQDEKLVIVSPAAEAWAAYDVDGTLIRWGPASAGANYCRDIGKPCHTHPGSFRVFTLGSSNCISHKFPLPNGGAPMPYCMYFNNGQALHGEPNGLPGYNASHGCVRLYVNDAEWLRYDFIEGPNPDNDYRGTQVIVEPYYPASSSSSPDEDDEE